MGGSTLQLQELHHFPNTPVTVRSTLYWNMLRLWRDIQAGIAKGMALQPASIGVDTWDVNFALLDAAGDLIGNSVHYPRPAHRWHARAGLDACGQRQDLCPHRHSIHADNTLYQLASLVERQSPQLNGARTFLTVPDLLNF